PVWQDQRAHSHYALIYIDQEGTVRHEWSHSISDHYKSILSPKVTFEFLKAVAESTGGGHCPSYVPSFGTKKTSRGSPTDQRCLSSHINQITHGLGCHEAEESVRFPMALRSSRQPASWPAQLFSGPSRTRRSLQQRRRPAENELSLSLQTIISLSDTHFLRCYYTKVFENLQQTNCRLIAKAYVKLVEPRKQVFYPYNGRKTVAGKTHELTPDETKPPWWPSGVRHREPDHLPKAERIRLLVHILCELYTSHGVTAQKLKAAEQPVRRQIFPTGRVHLLDELYYVREMEENFLAARNEGEPRVCISPTNFPDFEVATSRDQANRRSSLVIEEPEPESTYIPMWPIQGSNTLALSPDAYAIVDSPAQCPKQDVVINTCFDTASSSMPPSGIKRKRTYLETGGPPTISPMPIVCYSPTYYGFSFLSAQSFVEPSGI
ncbi:hypothetical protein N7499_004240, partial [Penicillium canescens]